MGSRKKTLSTIAVPPCFSYFLRTSAYYYSSLRRSCNIAYSLPIVARHGNEIEPTLNADCKRRKETLNMVTGRTSND